MDEAMQAVVPIKAPRRPDGPSDSIRLEAESDRYTSVVVVAVRPRRRDFWRVLTGRYKPKVIRRSVVSLAGADKILKEVWSGPVREQLAARHPLLDRLEGRKPPVP